MADMPEADWRRSSYCEVNSCVEVSFVGDSVALRDSKDRNGPVLQFSKTAWIEFLDGVRNREFDSQ
jgi:hypothetical protein